VRALRRSLSALLAPVLLALAAGAAFPLPAQQPAQRAAVEGRVLEAVSRAAVPGAIVTIEGTALRAITDAEGRYRLERVPPGPQMLAVRRIGFAPARLPITVPTTGTLERDVELAAAALRMRDVIVTADPAGRARGEVATASVIDRDAIANQTAASLAGILELTPGVPLAPPGLDAAQQISLRSAPTSSGGVVGAASPATADLAAFGTLILLDEVPLSNNANLQGLGPRGEISVPGTATGGIDLRRIPATTIERVEVIRGVPSVRYGDLTNGAIVVDTRVEAVAPELATRADARSIEVSVVGGSALGTRSAATLSADVAHTRLAPGVREDDALRLGFQLAHRLSLGHAAWGEEEAGRPKLVLDTRADVSSLIEDNPEDTTVAVGVSSAAHDTQLRLSERMRLALGRRDLLTVTMALDHTRQRSFSTQAMIRGATPFTDRLADGRQIGHYVIGQYVARVDLQGDPWLIYGRAELDLPRRLFAGAEHRLRAGAEWRREWNGGPGFLFDIEFPPQSRFNGVNGFDRPRRFDEIPPVATSALYLDDRAVRTVLGAALDLQAGLRLDLLHRGTTWFSGPRSAVLEPRLSAQLAPRPWLRLRGGIGRTAKAPRVADLYPSPQYYDVVNVNWYANDPAERLAVLTTSIRSPENPDLSFSTARKAEGGVEVGLGRAGAIALIRFSDRVNGSVGFRSTPGFLLRDHYDLSDSTLGTGLPPTIIEPPSYSDTVPILLDRPDNVIDIRSSGWELTASLPEIRAIRTRLDVQGAWVKTTVVKRGLDLGVRFSDFSLTENVPRTPYWENPGRYGQRTIITTRIVHHQPGLGLVITATIQHLLNEQRYDIAGSDTLAWSGYMTRRGQLVPVPAAQRGDSQYADLRLNRSGVATQPFGPPDDWLASLQVAKTLPMGGRLSFYAFNVLSRQGKYTVAARPFSPVRFGLELTLPVQGVVEALR